MSEPFAEPQPAPDETPDVGSDTSDDDDAAATDDDEGDSGE